MLLYLLQHHSRDTFSADTMLPYRSNCLEPEASVQCLVPIIIGAQSLDQ
jgi:hypothetical protein